MTIFQAVETMLSKTVPRRVVSVVSLVALVATLMPAATLGEKQATWPGKTWRIVAPELLGLESEELESAKRYALSQGGSGMIIRYGKVAMQWGDQERRYDIKSASKSIGATALGIAIQDGRLKLSDRASDRHPKFGVPPESNAKTGWLNDITLLHLATHTAGFSKPGDYQELLFPPGTKWHYSDCGPNWLAECVTLAFHRDVEQLMFERVFAPIGIERDDLKWRKNQYRDQDINGIPRREFGSGVHANVDALARIGYLYLRDGSWNGNEILSPEFIKLATNPVKSIVGLPELEEDHGDASEHYGLLWWNNADGALPQIPRDAFWAWGLYDSLIVVIPTLDLVVARAGARGKSWPRKEGENHYHVLGPFLNPIVDTAKPLRNTASNGPPTRPYPPSPVIRSVQWASPDTIVRKAKGGDNWPITWGDDDLLYTAYGDGKGFKPNVDRKLSLGLATVAGDPLKFKATNLRSDCELVGDGAKAHKASGLLMVDGRLHMFVRNAENSQLGWSDDHGKSWTWADWKFNESFGCPTFLNYGANYSGATDGYVYVYSFDSDSAYEPADQMVLVRVPKDKITERSAYEFFVKLDSNRRPIWTKQIRDRGAVFKHPRRCYRSGITFNAELGRYLWVQIIPDLLGKRADTRFEGGFGIYDAPAPWGPWTTVFFTERWDVGPGETAHFPTKWISKGGRTLHLVFSGDDCFSVRRATLTLHR